MLKAEIDGMIGKVNIQRSGSLLDFMVDITFLLRGVYNGLGSAEEKAAFREVLKDLADNQTYVGLNYIDKMEEEK